MGVTWRAKSWTACFAAPGIPERWLDRYRNTLPFVAGPLAVMGFKWNEVNGTRVWFVKVPGG